MNPSILVVGCGSIGQRHIRNLRSLGVGDILVFDESTDRLGTFKSDNAIAVCSSFEAGLRQNPGAVLVCTPPRSHLEIAKRTLEAGVHVFVEKPISHQIEGLAELIKISNNSKLTLMVGYNLRFHDGIKKAKALLEQGTIGRVLTIDAEFGQYLPDWRPGEDYRSSYFAKESEGGGIILDLSHELDYVRWLGGEVESMYSVAGNLGELNIAVEDTAFMLMRLANDVIASIRIDCVQRGYWRSCKIVGTTGVIVWNFNDGIRFVEGRSDTQVRNIEVDPDINHMYMNEMSHFLDCVAGRSEPLVNGQEGLRVMELVMAAKKSALLRKEILV